MGPKKTESCDIFTFKFFIYILLKTKPINKNKYLEIIEFLLCQSISLPDYRHDIDALVQQMHELDVHRPQTVSRRVDEIEATMNPVVCDVATVQSRFVAKIILKLILNILHDRLKALGTIEGVSEPGCVNHSQLQSNT